MTLRWITVTVTRSVPAEPKPNIMEQPQVLLLPDRCVCSILGYLIPQLLCLTPIPTLITRPVDKSPIQLLKRRHYQKDQVSVEHFTDIYTKSKFLAYLHVAPREEVAGQGYLVTDACVLLVWLVYTCHGTQLDGCTHSVTTNRGLVKLTMATIQKHSLDEQGCTVTQHGSKKRHSDHWQPLGGR